MNAESPDGSRLLEREIGRLRQEGILCSTRIFGEGALAPPEDLIARSNLLHVPADRLNLTGDVEASAKPNSMV